MTDITIIHNPRCSKSRQTLALLEEKGLSPVVRFLWVPQLSILVHFSAIINRIQRDEVPGTFQNHF